MRLQVPDEQEPSLLRGALANRSNAFDRATRRSPLELQKKDRTDQALWESRTPTRPLQAP
jgi:hypothetical protein